MGVYFNTDGFDGTGLFSHYKRRVSALVLLNHFFFLSVVIFLLLAKFGKMMKKFSHVLDLKNFFGFFR